MTTATIALVAVGTVVVLVLFVIMRRKQEEVRRAHEGEE